MEWDAVKNAIVMCDGGTGYLVASDIIVTCEHVAEAKAIGATAWVTFAKELGLEADEATIIAIDPAADCTILQLSKPVSVTPLPLASNTFFQRKGEWECYGYPEITGVQGLPLEGQVRDVKGKDKTGADAIILYAAQVQRENAHGFSGSPVLMQGQVIGHLKRILDDDQGNAQMGILYACPWTAIRRLLLEGSVPDAPRPNLPALAEVKRYFQALMNRTAELPTYYPKRLQPTQEGETVFDRIRQTVQVIQDREKFARWAEEERQRAMGQFDPRAYDPNKARPELEGYGDKQRESSKPPEPPIEWEEAVQKYPRLVILGDPGFGKSWLLRYEARRLAKRALEELAAGRSLDTIPLPILTRLSDVARYAKTRTVTAALAAMASQQEQEQPFSAAFQDWITQRLQNETAVVLLDAWDEVAEMPANPGEVLTRSALAEKLKGFSSKRILFTSRGAGYTGSPVSEAQEVELIAFEQSQIEGFTQVWFNDKPQPFLALLKEQPQLHGLARIPLMLSLLCRMFEADTATTFPQTRGEIYEGCLRGLLQEWKEEKQLGTEVEDVDALLEALATIAYALPIEQGAFKRSFLRQQVVRWLKTLHASDSYYGEKPEAIIKRLLQDGILTKANEENDPDYLFLHRTFHEYLTAAALAGQEDWLALACARIYDPGWQQVLILLGRSLKTKEQAESYIARLQAEQDVQNDIFFRPLLLANFAAQERGNDVSEQWQENLCQGLLHLFLALPEWLEKDWFSPALVGWRKRTVEKLCGVPLNTKLTEPTRVDAAEILIQMHAYDAIPALIGFLKDESVTEKSRCQILDALMQIPPEPSDPMLNLLGRPSRTLFSQRLIPHFEPREVPADALGRAAIPDLSALLQDDTVSKVVRTKITWVLFWMQSRAAIPGWRAILQDRSQDKQLRAIAAEALGLMQAYEAIPDLLIHLQDETLDITDDDDHYGEPTTAESGIMGDSERIEVAKALGQLQAREAIPLLTALVMNHSINEYVRCDFGAVLGPLLARESLPDLLSIFRDGSIKYKIQRAAFEAIKQMPEKEAVPALKAIAQDNEVVEEVLRHDAAEALWQAQGQNALSDILATRKGQAPNSFWRRRVEELLQQIPAAELTTELLTLVQDETTDVGVRREAVELLGQKQTTTVIAKFHHLVNDGFLNVMVRRSILDVLIQLQAHEAIPDVLAFLKDNAVDVDTRQKLAQDKKVWELLQPQEAIPELRSLIQDKAVNITVRLAVAKALEQTQAREANPELLYLLREQETDLALRCDIALTLGRRQVSEAIPDLLVLFTDEAVEMKVRLKLAKLLSQMNAQEAIPEFLALLQKKTEIHLDIVNLLVQMQSREVIPELVSLFKEAVYAWDRRHPIALLVQMQAREATSELLALLKDDTVQHRVQLDALTIIERLQAREAIPELLNLLKSETVNHQVRLESLTTIERMQAREAIPELLNLLKDDAVNYSVRLNALTTIGRMQAREAIPELLNLLKDDTVDTELHAFIVVALGALRAHEAIPELLALLKDNEAEHGVRGSAAAILGQILAEDSVPELLALLLDQSVPLLVRLDIAHALINRRAMEAIPAILCLLKDTSLTERSRSAIAKALIDRHVMEAIPAILSLFKDISITEISQIAIGLAQWARTETIPGLRIFLQENTVDSSIRCLLVGFLGSFSARGAIPDLLVLLKDNGIDDDIRAAAAGALMEMPAQEAIPELRIMVNDASIKTEARLKIIHSLEWMQATEAIPELRALVNDTVVGQELRCAAAVALGKLTAQEATPDLLTLIQRGLRDSDVAILDDLIKSEESTLESTESEAQELEGKESESEVESEFQREISDWKWVCDKSGYGADSRTERTNDLIKTLGEKATPELLAYLQDKTKPGKNRADIVKALVEMQVREAMPAILDYLKREWTGGYGRQSVLEALVRMQDRKTILELLDLLINEMVFWLLDDGSVADMLVRMQAREAIPLLRNALKDKSLEDFTRKGIVDALEQLQAREAIPDFLTLLQDESADGRVRVAVVEALRQMQARETIPELLAMLQNESVEAGVRVAIATTLGQMQSQAAIPDLLTFLKDESVDAGERRKVARSLWKLAQAEKRPLSF